MPENNTPLNTVDKIDRVVDLLVQGMYVGVRPDCDVDFVQLNRLADTLDKLTASRDRISKQR